MTRKRKMGVCNCIALYDWNPKTAKPEEWLKYMEKWAEQIGMLWESMGIGPALKLMQFKNGKRKLMNNHFENVTSLGLMGGVVTPGTNDDWKIYCHLPLRERSEAYLCFADSLASFKKEVLLEFTKNLLQFADFKYGICYQREFNKGPSSYAGGAIETYGELELSEKEEDQIAAWMHEYNFEDGGYRTGLLRDVYPFNIFVATHLIEKVGNTTLEAWIDADPTHGTLEKITDNHWLWSIDSDHIPAAQETLQEAGLLLCYKV